MPITAFKPRPGPQTLQIAFAGLLIAVGLQPPLATSSRFWSDDEPGHHVDDSPVVDVMVTVRRTAGRGSREQGAARLPYPVAFRVIGGCRGSAECIGHRADGRSVVGQGQEIPIRRSRFTMRWLGAAFGTSPARVVFHGIFMRVAAIASCPDRMLGDRQRWISGGTKGGRGQ